jgi:hypothetical protein
MESGILGEENFYCPNFVSGKFILQVTEYDYDRDKKRKHLPHPLRQAIGCYGAGRGAILLRLRQNFHLHGPRVGRENSGVAISATAIRESLSKGRPSTPHTGEGRRMSSRRSMRGRGGPCGSTLTKTPLRAIIPKRLGRGHMRCLRSSETAL